MLEKILKHKKQEVDQRKIELSLPELIKQAARSKDLPPLDKAFTKSADSSIIAEIKFASPSHGSFEASKNHLEMAATYLDHGACAISMLTDTTFFQGDRKFLKETRLEFPRAFLLQKDFIVDEYQIYEAKTLGANGLLLISDALSDDNLSSFLDLSRKLGMEPLVESHSRENFLRSQAAGAKLVGINNRNLKNMEINLEHSRSLSPLFKKGHFYICESGILEREEVEEMEGHGFQAFLVGSSLMNSQNPGKKLDQLRGICL